MVRQQMLAQSDEIRRVEIEQYSLLAGDHWVRAHENINSAWSQAKWTHFSSPEGTRRLPRTSMPSSL